MGSTPGVAVALSCAAGACRPEARTWHRRQGPTWKRPARTSLNAMMAAPSSTSRRLLGGMDPGVMPPTSAWWPRDATKNLRRGARSAAGGLVADARRRGGRGALDAALVEHGRDDGDVGQVRPARQLRVVGRQHVARAQALGRALALRAPEVRLHARPQSAQSAAVRSALRGRAHWQAQGRAGARGTRAPGTGWPRTWRPGARAGAARWRPARQRGRRARS